MLRCDELDARLRRRSAPVPLIVLRLPAIEQVAWRAGRRQARRLERRAVDAFAALAARLLRAGDLLAHDAQSDRFVCALATRPRATASEASPLDVRAALARLAGGLERATGADASGGWTLHRARAEQAGAEAVVERALRAGEQERTRYAFFSAVGHELRTPLSAVRGYLETALDEADETQRRRFLAVAHRETLRLCRLVDGMFEISLLDLHPASPARRTTPLSRVVAALADGCAASARARNVTVRFGGVPRVRVAGAVDHLVLALLNVLENAVKHGRAGGVVDVGVRCGPRTVRVTVDDDGPGIPAAQRERVFELGERGASAGAGTGIGLATTRLIVERLGGKVVASASPAGGARFVVTVPRAAEPRRRRPAGRAG